MSGVLTGLVTSAVHASTTKTRYLNTQSSIVVVVTLRTKSKFRPVLNRKHSTRLKLSIKLRPMKKNLVTTNANAAHANNKLLF